MTNKNESYTTGQVAQLLGRHRTTIYRAARSGKITSCRVLGTYRIPAAVVHAMLQQIQDAEAAA